MSTAEALLALSWLLRRPVPAAHAAGGPGPVNGTGRPRSARGRLATDPGA